ncbi:uncharacterized protein BDZ83DRAFT_645545 [Colletotrichum acutatum]|uniref:Uncharacterized protein n=1 Tax=Glomerella acutata TaxID=27357 RepID=A0AAD8U878_GLOAC|nr:uncharacterized protein BDZ83DRAFT_645545 [Colletotrichum acutatum]KAK1701768.1 hypothetical protein BDZ83DRAFT_645545 [Colletotrichum acutatum]
MQQTEHPHAEIEADDGISTGDLFEDSSVASLRSSILEHEVENGRTYHSMSSGSTYFLPMSSKYHHRIDYALVRIPIPE